VRAGISLPRKFDVISLQDKQLPIHVIYVLTKGWNGSRMMLVEKCVPALPRTLFLFWYVLRPGFTEGAFVFGAKRQWQVPTPLRHSERSEESRLACNVTDVDGNIEDPRSSARASPIDRDVAHIQPGFLATLGMTTSS
jgi:hypothetical protein